MSHDLERHVSEPFVAAAQRALSRTVGNVANGESFRVAIETACVNAIVEARKKLPPPVPKAARETGNLPASMDPHDRPTRPDGLPRLTPTGAPARKPVPKGAFHGP